MKLLIGIFLLFISFSSISSAQTVVCDECPGTMWEPASVPYFEYTADVFDGQVKITYQTRDCNGTKEIKIISMEILPGVNLKDNYTLEEIYIRAMNELMINNPMNFPPIGNDESNLWRIIQGACWNYNGIESLELIPCNDDCCVTTVVVYLCNSNRYYQLNKKSGVPLCPDINPISGIECNYICDPLYKELFENMNTTIEN